MRGVQRSLWGKWRQFRGSVSLLLRKSEVVQRVISTDNTHEPGGGMLLDCSRSRVCRIQEESVQYLYYENAYKGRGTSHVKGVRKACTEGAVIHKAAMRRYGYKGGAKGAHQQVLMHM